MTLADELEALAKDDKHKVLRFSVSDAGHYRWGSVKTDCMSVARFLCVCWRERGSIIAALRAKDDAAAHIRAQSEEIAQLIKALTEIAAPFEDFPPERYKSFQCDAAWHSMAMEQQDIARTALKEPGA